MSVREQQEVKDRELEFIKLTRKVRDGIMKKVGKKNG